MENKARRRLAGIILGLVSSVAQAAGPQPCYFSGTFVKCFPSSGLNIPGITWTDTTLGVVGTTTNNDAVAGRVGEYKEARVTVATTIASSATYFDITSILLTAGDWDCSAAAYIERNGATMTNAEVQIGIGCASGTGTTGLAIGYSSVDWDLGSGASVLTFGDMSPVVPPLRIQSTGTNLIYGGTTCSSVQTIYLKGYLASFSVGTPKYRGSLRCRRVR